jgi:hypothetical protein
MLRRMRLDRSVCPELSPFYRNAIWPPSSGFGHPPFRRLLLALQIIRYRHPLC